MSPVRRITALLANLLLLHLLWVGSAGACAMMRTDGMASRMGTAGATSAVAAQHDDCAGAVGAPSSSAPASPCTNGHMAGTCAMMAQCAPASMQRAAHLAASPPLRGAAPHALLAAEHAAPDLRPTPPPPRV